MLLLDFINLCDGKTSFLDIADKLSIPAWDLYDVVGVLDSHNLIVSS